VWVSSPSRSKEQPAIFSISPIYAPSCCNAHLTTTGEVALLFLVNQFFPPHPHDRTFSHPAEFFDPSVTDIAWCLSRRQRGTMPSEGALRKSRRYPAELEEHFGELPYGGCLRSLHVRLWLDQFRGRCHGHTICPLASL
jgi:hypothetical protein